MNACRSLLRARSAVLVAATMSWTILGLAAGPALGQAQVRNFPTQPILAVNTGGHSAPVRALVFSEPDGSELLSAGMDKVVNVWSLRAGRPALERTLRPPVWRGYRGAIYTMALSPPVAGKARMLAVAGYGVENNQSRISLFHFPGANVPTGDIESLLPDENIGAAEPTGHANTVMSLAFDPTGRDLLASCSVDGTVRLWDFRARRLLAVLRGHVGAVNALAFAPDGRRLASGGEDGVLRLWNVDQRVLQAQAAPANADLSRDDPRGNAILALAASADGRWIVVGRENGLLQRYDAANLSSAVRLEPNVRGPVEALALSSDGKRLATSIVARRNAATERPRAGCAIELRSMPDGRVTDRVRTASNLVYALAFSPNGRYLAFAGGDAQGVYVKDLREPARALVALEGKGRSIWEVAFRGDSQAVAYAPARADLPGFPAQAEGFDLQARKRVGLAWAGLSGPITTMQGWSIRPTGPLGLEVANGQGVRYAIALDGAQDRRWWSYSFVPAGPGHARTTVAIGCEAGVAFYAFDMAQRRYVRTRLYAGHNGPVFALAPAPDGRWLATGSPDQTVRLWRLAGCDERPPLGATFAPGGAGDGPVVTSVLPLSFAEGMGLKPGDQIELFVIDGKALEPAQIAERVAVAPPGASVELRVRRGAARANVGTTRRDAPALALFPGADGEWVLWMPEGFYDTSIAGDRRFLGWQRNRADLHLPTDYFAIDRFENALRQPGVLDRLWATADLGRALTALPDPALDPARLVDDERPPAIRVPEPLRRPDVPLAVPAAALAVRAQVSSEGRRPIQSVRFLVDSGQGPRFDFAPPRPEVDQRAQLNLTPGVHRINVVATNDRGRERAESFEVVFQPPQPRLPQLVVRAIGVGLFLGNERLAIPFADRDAQATGRFLADQGRTGAAQVDSSAPLVGPSATSSEIGQMLAALDAKREKGDLRKGDIVVLSIESHLLVSDQGGFLLGSDAGAVTGSRPPSAVRASDLTELLGRLADYGCRVVLLIDAVHESTPREWHSNISDWARQLWKRNVIVFVASNQGPSLRLPFRYRHGAFAQGIIESLDVPTRARLWVKSDQPLTLNDFQEAVVERVQDLTSRRQVPACYVPETQPSQVPLLAPQPAGGAEVSGR